MPVCVEPSKKYDTYTTLIDQSQGSILFWIQLFGTVLIKDTWVLWRILNKQGIYRFDGLKKTYRLVGFSWICHSNIRQTLYICTF